MEGRSKRERGRGVLTAMKKPQEFLKDPSVPELYVIWQTSAIDTASSTEELEEGCEEGESVHRILWCVDFYFHNHECLATIEEHDTYEDAISSVLDRPLVLWDELD